MTQVKGNSFQVVNKTADKTAKRWRGSCPVAVRVLRKAAKTARCHRRSLSVATVAIWRSFVIAWQATALGNGWRPPSPMSGAINRRFAPTSPHTKA